MQEVEGEREGGGREERGAHLSCLVMACPLSESTLKLLVHVGKMRNATTVMSLLLDLR